MSGESRAECGGMPTLVDDKFMAFVVESFGFESVLLVDVAPVVAPSATLAESLVHSGLGLGSVLDNGTGRERAFSASHDGRMWDGDFIGWVYIGGIKRSSPVTSCGSKVSVQPDRPAKIVKYSASTLRPAFPRPFQSEPFFRPHSLSL